MIILFDFIIYELILVKKNTKHFIMTR